MTNAQATLRLIPGVLAAIILIALVVLAAASSRGEAGAAYPRPAIVSIDFDFVNGTYTPPQGDPVDFLTNVACYPASRFEAQADAYAIIKADATIVGDCGYSLIGGASSGTLTGQVDAEGNVSFMSQATTHDYSQPGASLQFTQDWLITFDGTGSLTSDTEGSGVATMTLSCSATGEAPSCNIPFTVTGNVPWTISLSPLVSPSTADISIDRVELVQATHPLQGDTHAPAVPLIKGKTTVARVFVKSSTLVTGITGTLAAKTVFGPLPGEAVLLGGPAIGAPFSPPELDGSLSLDFLLPVSWLTHSHLDLAVDIYPPAGTADPHEGDNGTFVYPDFEPGGSLNVGYIRVCYPTPSDCPGSDIENADALFQEIMPLDQSSWTYGPLPIGSLTYTKPLATNDDMSRFGVYLRKLTAFMRLLDYLFFGEIRDQMLAWLPNDPGIPIDSQAASPWWYHVRFSSWAKDLGGASSELELAQNVANNLGVGPPAKVGSSDPCMSQLPENAAKWLYADPTIHGWGFDVGTASVIMPSRVDIGARCNGPPHWVSPQAFATMHDALSGAGFPSGAGLTSDSVTTPLLVVSGSAKADGSGGSLESGYRVEAPAASADQTVSGGNHCLVFSGGSGEISRFCFDLTFQLPGGQSLGQESFTFTVPLPSGTTKLALDNTNGELAALHLSANAPTLQITSPTVGDQWTGTHTITWAATDADSDSLTYSVFYSPNGGNVWYPLAIDVSDPQLSIDTVDLSSGSNVMFRVLASDGLNTGSQTVGPVQVGLPGDADCNGVVTVADALAVLRSTANLPVTAGCLADANVNCDAVLDATDALAILRAIAKLPLNLPPGCPEIPAA